jgi:hypothetical protein
VGTAVNKHKVNGPMGMRSKKTRSFWIVIRVSGAIKEIK